MKKRILRFLIFPLAVLMCLTAFLFAACSKKNEDTSNIVSVTALGFVDYDGVKLQGIAVEYGCNLHGSDISNDTFEIGVYSIITCLYKGDGNIGDITNVYINNEAAISETGGTGAGNYAIIEVFTDYWSSTDLTYTNTMSVNVRQAKDITLEDGTVLPAEEKAVSNGLNGGTKEYNFSIPDIDGFKYYTNTESSYRRDGDAFYAENCFDQRDGLYYDVELSYALWLPADYNSNGSYALVTLQNPAATSGTLPLTAVLQYRSAAVYASDYIQNLVKEQDGVDGLIVLVPVVTERVDDNGGTPAEYEAIVRLWDKVIDEYHVNTNYIYGSGQSVGGMILLETNRNRDNFFAGVLLYDDQWGQDYYIDQIFERGMSSNSRIADRATMHYPRTNGDITWDYYLDSQGNEVTDDYDPYNYYYLISDDNIMILNEEGGGMSNDTWGEMKYLYHDLVGYDLQQKVIDGTQSLDAQCAELTEFTNRTDDALNINWISFSGIETSRKVDASYAWLVTQTRDSEIKRDKLDLNKPFATADQQDLSEERKLSFHTADGDDIYYKTGKYGAGTRGYNTCLLNTTTTADAVPGWLPEGMSWDTGVEFAEIQSVTAIGSNAVAIQYDKDMSGLVINIIGDKVYNYLSGEYRDDDFIVVDPYDFYDTYGNKIECNIANVYVNSTPTTNAGAERNSGSGCYVIVVFNAGISATPVQVIQRTTVRTNTVIASASHKLKG